MCGNGGLTMKLLILILLLSCIMATAAGDYPYGLPRLIEPDGHISWVLDKEE
jgi:hypothetical protein